MGGVDNQNATTRVLDTLNECSLPPDCQITVVLGANSPWQEQVREGAAKMTLPTHVRVGVKNMAQLMADSDLAIGAAGSTSWERCCLGLPSLIVVLAENQEEIAQALGCSGAAISLSTPFSNDFQAELQRAMIEVGIGSERLSRLSVCAANITDGQGVTNAIQNFKSLAEE
jgi:spore coat polysaccharide biosynthesis predicted glycosyltransferase SpsG